MTSAIRPSERAPAEYDVAVLGLGALGTAALWRLAESGARVIGIEQFSPPHALGGTHGLTRLFRTFCLEHPALGDYASLSQALFRALQQESGESLLSLSGGILIGRPDSLVVRRTLAAAKYAGITLPVLSASELVARYPQHQAVRKDEIAVIDPQAGVANPEGFIRAALGKASRLGAEIRTSTRVLSLQEQGSGVRIATPAGDISAGQVVIACGAWLSQFVPALPFDPVRTVMTWFASTAGYDLADFPVFVREINRDLTLWGHGAAAGGAVKLGLADIGVVRSRLNPDRMDKEIHPEDTALLSQTVRHWLADIQPQPIAAHPCMITRTPDGQFIVGRYRRRILVAGGDSGHAFKHAPAIGELIAALAAGRSVALDTAFIDPRRFL